MGYKLLIKNNHALYKSESIFSLRFFWVASVILILLKLSPFLQANALSRVEGDLAEVRADYFDQSQSSMDVVLGFITSLFEPIVSVSGIVFFLQDFKKNYGCLFAILVLALMESVISGGRFGIAHILLEFLVCYFFLHNNGRTFNKLNKLVLYAFIAVLAYAIIEITSMRGIHSDSVNGHFYAYLCGCIKFFDLRLETLNDTSYYPFGSALMGLWYNLFRILHVIGIPYPDWYMHISKIIRTDETSMIGDDIYINAFSTPFYHLYFDMGWIGVIIGMYILGLFACYVYRRALKCPNTPNIVFFVIVIQMLFMTIFSYPLVNTGYVLIILYMLFTKRLFR